MTRQANGQRTLGIDFGTSNTAAAVMREGRPHLIELEPGNGTFPTAVFFDASDRKALFGNAAVAALIDGREGRFMRSLKSVLGSNLMREKRQLQHERLTLIEVVAKILADVKTKSEASCDQSFDHVLSGRPVHFHGHEADRDARALVDLEECYRLAGFTEVEFQYEPEAAALASGNIGADDSTGLIVDIGGGTSDFSVFNCRAGKIEIVASHGMRLGGTDFDRALSIAHVMPLFGKGTEIRNVLGPGTNIAPNAIFNDLATWQMIPFLYTGDIRRRVAEMAKMAVEKTKLDRLLTVLEMELGHDVAFAVEAGKIAANGPNRHGVIDLNVVENGLSASLASADLDNDLAAYSQQIRQGALETLTLAGLAAENLDKIVFVGGSSLMGIVDRSMRDLFPQASPEYANAMTAVIDGLAISADRLDRG